MKQNQNLQKWIPSALVGLALAASTSLALAADISYTFDSDVQGWYAADGHGTVTWGGTNGRGGGGCLVCTIPADGTTNAPSDTEIDPRVDVAFDTLGYFCVEFDMMVDPSSGIDANLLYGNLQVVARTSGWSWDSMWYGSIGGPTGPFSVWKHVKMVFASAYGPKAHLQFQLQNSAVGGDPLTTYTTNVIVYIDNVVIRDGTPPLKAMLYDFTWPEQCTPDSTWGAGPPVWSQDTTLNPTNPCLKEVVIWDGAATNWQDAPGEFHGPAFDPSKFTYIDFDLYLDAPTGLSSYGGYQLQDWWGWHGVANVNLTEANIGKWTHYSFPLPAYAWNGVVLHPGGNPPLSGTFTYYLDNVTLWKPATPPTIKKMVKASGAGGVQITMDQDGAANQWQREAFVTDSATGPYNWSAQGVPVSYSFTITNFPPAGPNHGFEAHMYLVNADTGGGVTGWNATYGGVDWNVPDILKFSVENNPAGGVFAHIDWKTNLPNANPPTNDFYHPAYVSGPTAIGTWTLTFTSATDGILTGPGGVSTNFTMPAEAVANNFSPVSDYIQFGAFKNDGAADGHNDQASCIFSEVAISNSTGTVLYDNFPGPGLQGSGILWRKTTSSGGATAVQWIPPGLAYLMTWTLPDDGFEMYVGTDIKGPFSDAGVGQVNGFTYSQGATRIGGVPIANMPTDSDKAGYFQLRKY